uniref:Uncharacterized protein n=1 Tax=viral metagenome TaxID=1070528 RepID=A0A6M3J0B0_9ZZZZ
MPRYAHLEDGRTLEFPDDTTNEVMQKTVKKILGVGEAVTSMPSEQMPIKSKGLPVDQEGLYRDPSGQLVFDPRFPESLSMFKGTGLEQMHDASRTLMGGASRLARGVLPLPYDIMDYFGVVGTKEMAEDVRKNIPIIPAGTTLGALGQTLVQYGVPQIATTKIINGLSRGLPSAITTMRQLLAGGLSDFLAATPEEETLGDLVGGPTETRKEDSPLIRKAKIGVEGTVVPTALHPVWWGVGGVKKLFQKTIGTMVNPEKPLRKYVTNILRHQVNVDEAIKNIDETMQLVSGTGFLPTTGPASGLPGLITVEKGLTQAKGGGPMYSPSVLFLERFIENKRVINRQLESVTKAMQGSTEEARRYLEEYIAKPLRVAQEQLEILEVRMARSKEETANFINDFALMESGRQADASELIDATVKSQLDSMTAQKNALYSAIDPDNKVVIPKERIKAVIDDITTGKSRLDDAPQKLPKDIIRDLRRIVDPPKEGQIEVPLTFGELQDIRPRLSEAIAKAREKNQGHVVERLEKLKRTVEMEGNYLEEIGGEASIAAKKANDYYRNEYAPRFKELVGDAYRKAVRKGAPIPPTAVGDKFLSQRSAARESAVQLNEIVKTAPNKIEAEIAIRDHVVADFASLMSDKNGNAIIGRIDKYLKSRPVRESLEQFPDVKREILEFRNNLYRKVAVENDLSKEIKTTKESLKLTEKEQRKSATRFFVDSDPVVAVGRVMNSLDPENEMKELVRIAKHDTTGEAVKGLKVSLNEYVDETTRTTMEVLGSDKLDISKAKVTKLLRTNRTRKALEQLYTPSEMRTLDKMQEMMELIERVNIKATSGSITTPLSSAVKKVEVMLYSTVGLVRGRGIAMIGKLIQKMTGRDPTEIALRLTTDAMLDPELAKLMLLPDIPSNQKIAKAHFTKYIANNILNEAKTQVSDWLESEKEEQ